MEIEFKVRIIRQEVRQQLYESGLFAGGVLLCAILIGLFIPPLAPFLIGVGAVGAFLACKPYFKLRAQEKTPSRLAITQQRLIFYVNDQKIVSIPLRAIHKIAFDEGVVLFLKKPLLEPIEVLDAKWLKNRKQGDFFFEWFEPNVFAILNQEIKNVSQAE